MLEFLGEAIKQQTAWMHRFMPWTRCSQILWTTPIWPWCSPVMRLRCWPTAHMRGKEKEAKMERMRMARSRSAQRSARRNNMQASRRSTSTLVMVVTHKATSLDKHRATGISKASSPRLLVLMGLPRMPPTDLQTTKKRRSLSKNKILISKQIDTRSSSKRASHSTQRTTWMTPKTSWLQLETRSVLDKGRLQPSTFQSQFQSWTWITAPPKAK